MSQFALDIIAGRADNNVVKCPWQSIRITPSMSYQVDKIVTKEELYVFQIHKWKNGLTRKWYVLYRDHYHLDTELTFDPKLKGKLTHKTWKYPWTFEAMDTKGYDFAIATQEREDGRYNVSAAKFYRNKKR